MTAAEIERRATVEEIWASRNVWADHLNALRRRAWEARLFHAAVEQPPQPLRHPANISERRMEVLS
jgi:hypothetical protein